MAWYKPLQNMQGSQSMVYFGDWTINIHCVNTLHANKSSLPKFNVANTQRLGETESSRKGR
jgi:hypothetical protein